MKTTTNPTAPLRIVIVLLFINVFSCSFGGIDLYAQTTAIPDPNFEQALIDLEIDSDGIINGQVLTADVETVTELYISFKEISDLTGIEAFTALEILDVSENFLTSLNLSSNLELKILNCYENWLSELDLTNNVLLEELYCGNSIFNDANQNSYEILDLSNNPALKILSCEAASVSFLNIDECIQLEELYIAFTGLDVVDLSNNQALKILRLGFLFIDPLDGNIYHSNLGMTEIDLSQNTSLENLYSSYTYLETINVKNGANSILTVNTLNSPNLYCIQLDDEDAATNGQFPYSSWEVDPQVIFSEMECTLSTNSFSNLYFSIYPIPATETLFIKSSEITGNISANFYSLNGKLLHQQNLNTSMSEVDVRHLNTGVYFIVFTNETGLKQTLKFIKK